MYLIIERDADDERYLGVVETIDQAVAGVQVYVEVQYDGTEGLDTTLSWSPMNLDAPRHPFGDQVVTRADDPAASVTYEIAFVPDII